MNKEQLQEILKDISAVKIAVVGDFCLDAYWFIDESKSEISIETGQKTRPVKEQRYSLGGAGNVTNNLTAMGVKDVRAFGVIGSSKGAVFVLMCDKEINSTFDCGIYIRLVCRLRKERACEKA